MPSWGEAQVFWEVPPSHSPPGPPLGSRITSVVEHPISIHKEDLEEPQGKSVRSAAHQAGTSRSRRNRATTLSPVFEKALSLSSVQRTPPPGSPQGLSLW